MLVRHLDTPEVPPCVSGNALAAKKEEDPRSVLAFPEMGSAQNRKRTRGPSFRFRKILNQGKPEEVPRTT
nr:hypothetical protein [Aeromonas veronii]